MLAHDAAEEPAFTYANKVRWLLLQRIHCPHQIQHLRLVCGTCKPGRCMLQAALDLFEAEWEQLVGMPSKQSTADDPQVCTAE